MRLFLTYVLPVHWMVVFALLATRAASGGMQSALGMLGVTLPVDAQSFGMAASAVCATGFGFVAALFLWHLVVAFVGDSDFPGPADDVSSLAFGCAIALMTALLLFGAATPLQGLLPAVMFQIAALSASYAAVHAERRKLSLAPGEADDVRATARFMAAGAAHSSMLPRLAGRSSDRDGAI